MIDIILMMFYVWAIHECGHLALELYKYHYKEQYNTFILPIMINILALLVLFVFLFFIGFISFWFPFMWDIIRNILILPVILVAVTARIASRKVKEANV